MVIKIWLNLWVSKKKQPYKLNHDQFNFNLHKAINMEMDIKVRKEKKKKNVLVESYIITA